MKSLRKALLPILVLIAVSSACSLFLSPELSLIVRPNPGDDPADLAPGLEVYFGKPADGVQVIVEFTIENNGDGDLILEQSAPILDEVNESEQPFILTVDPEITVIGPGSSRTFTVTFTGQNTSTHYTTSLRIPSNDPEHPDYSLTLIGDGALYNN